MPDGLSERRSWQAETSDGRKTTTPGDRVAPTVAGYEILGELGRGGMGVVYKAREIRLNRPCALKMVLAGMHADPIAAVRFLAEAEAIARLQHPNIVQIHRIGQADGFHFIELEYVEGGSLDAHLDGTPWPARAAAQLVERLAQAVASAHAHGLVHRDLKPANILMALDGTPKVTDFGLVKSLADSNRLTATDSILGTPSYMAPEQAEGRTKEAGPAADIYSSGAILYELLTGRPPFKGATLLETLDQVKNSEVVPPTRLVPKLARDLETIVLVCLRKEPGRRYASAQALGEDLRRFLDGETILARRSGPLRRAWRWSRRKPVVAGLLATVTALLLLITLGSTGGALWMKRVAEDARRDRNDALVARGNEERARLDSQLALADMHVARGLVADEQGDPARVLLWFANAARVAGDDSGRVLANRVRVENWSRHALMPAAALPHDGPVEDLAFSPDGRYLLTHTTRGRNAVWDLDRDAPLPWAGGDGPPGPARLSPEGRSLALGTPAGVEIRAVPSGERLRSLAHPGPIRELAFSPDGRSLALAAPTTRVWDCREGRFATPELPHPGAESWPCRSARVGTCWRPAAPTAGRARGSRRSATGLPQVSPWIRAGPPSRWLRGDHEGLAAGLPRRRPDPPDRPRGAGPDLEPCEDRGDDPLLGRRGTVLVARPGPGGSVDRRRAHALDRPGRRRHRAGRPIHPRRDSYPPGDRLHDGRRDDGGGQPGPEPEALVDPRRPAADGPPANQPARQRVRHLPGRAPPGEYGVRRPGACAPDAPRRADRPQAPPRVRGGRRAPEPGPAAAHRGEGQLPLGSRADAGPRPRGRRRPAAHRAVPRARRLDRRCRRLARWPHRGDRLRTWHARSGQGSFDSGTRERAGGSPRRPRCPTRRRVAFSPDGSHVAAICQGNEVLVCEVEGGRVTRRLVHEYLRSVPNVTPGEHQMLFLIEFTPGGDGLITAGRRTIQVWDLADGRRRYPPLPHNSSVFGLCLSHDGRWLAAGSDDGYLRVWDFATGRPAAGPMREIDKVFQPLFSPDDRLIVAAGRDGTVRAWDWRAGRLAAPVMRHDTEVFGLAMTGEGRHLLTLTAHGRLRAWDWLPAVRLSLRSRSARPTPGT